MKLKLIDQMKIPITALLYGSLLVTSIVLFLWWKSYQRAIPGWGFDVSRNSSHYLNGDLPPKIFPEYFCNEKFLLLIMVCSAPDNFSARKAIRQTWGGKHIEGHEISVNFFIGDTPSAEIQRGISLESTQYGDIIQENFVDSYYNLTLKSIHMLKVSVRYCANTVKFLLKIDDDMFVNIPRLLEVLNETKHPQDLLLGRKACGKRPIRNLRSKWYTPNYIYSEDILPDFLSGTGYLMSLYVAERLYETAKVTPIMHLEDVYTTGICAKKAGIISQHNEDFNYEVVPDEPCLLKNLITMHHFCPARMTTTFAALEDEGITQNCEYYEPMFNAPWWLLANVFMPSYRLGRRRVCQ